MSAIPAGQDYILAVPAPVGKLHQARRRLLLQVQRLECSSGRPRAVPLLNLNVRQRSGSDVNAAEVVSTDTNKRVASLSLFKPANKRCSIASEALTTDNGGRVEMTHGTDNWIWDASPLLSNTDKSFKGWEFRVTLPGLHGVDNTAVVRWTLVKKARQERQRMMTESGTSSPRPSSPARCNSYPPVRPSFQSMRRHSSAATQGAPPAKSAYSWKFTIVRLPGSAHKVSSSNIAQAYLGPQALRVLGHPATNITQLMGDDVKPIMSQRRFPPGRVVELILSTALWVAMKEGYVNATVPPALPQCDPCTEQQAQQSSMSRSSSSPLLPTGALPVPRSPRSLSGETLHDSHHSAITPQATVVKVAPPMKTGHGKKMQRILTVLTLGLMHTKKRQMAGAAVA
ncbi:hypothetical protein YB2330_001524 [Saitoella coloradoensis]